MSTSYHDLSTYQLAKLAQSFPLDVVLDCFHDPRSTFHMRPSEPLRSLCRWVTGLTDVGHIFGLSHCSNICSMVEDEERPSSPHPDRRPAIALGYAVRVAVIAAVAIASYFLRHGR